MKTVIKTMRAGAVWAALGVAFGMGAIAPPASAQEIIGGEQVFDRTPTVEELNAIFAAEPEAAKPKVKTRQIVFGSAPKKTPEPAASPTPASAPATPRTASLQIQFDLNSARVRSEYSQSLANLAQAMHDNPSMVFEIGGHADAVGDAGYNKELSERRAASVRDYLVAIHGVEPERLSVVGYGESRLLPGLAGNDGRHRRVSFTGVQ